MNRRRFFRLAALGSVAPAVGALLGNPEKTSPGKPGPQESGDEDRGAVDPYFLDPGNIDPAEQKKVEDYVGYQDQLAAGKAATMPRGGRPRHAPTYRVLHWLGEVSDPSGRFVGPLSLTPAVQVSEGYQLNAQILGFHAASEDWPGHSEQGVLTIEIRARYRSEPLTWLYAQPFDLYEGGISTIGTEYVAQRGNTPTPVVTDAPSVDLRIQLMRHRKKLNILRKVFRVVTSVLGGPAGGALGSAAAAQEALATVRVPQMLREGAAMSQGVMGGLGEDAPVWRSGFVSFALAEGGGRLSLRPGLWAVMDEARELDLTGVRLQDIGQRYVLARKGEPLDLNYLILSFTIAGGLSPGALSLPAPQGSVEGRSPVIPRGKKPD